MAKLLSFFAADDDLKCVLMALESNLSVEYFPMESMADSGVTANDCLLSAAEDIPDFGIAFGRQKMACKMYLIVKSGVGINLRKIARNDGQKVVVIDQLENNDSVVVVLGGRYYGDSNVVIDGLFSTAYTDEFSGAVLKILRAELKKKFKIIKGCFVGPAALSVYREGGRLVCASIDSPKLYDLAE